MTTQAVDVAIIGAGIAGCHLAQMLAKHGVTTILVDKKPLCKAGPSWINAVPAWMFDEAGLSRPTGKELFDQNDRFIIRAPDKKNSVVINNLGLLDVHMEHLSNRLKEYFLKPGSSLQIDIIGARYQQGRMHEVVGTNTHGEQVTIKAQLFVDASGQKAILRKSHPRANHLWPPVTREDTCTAVQMTFCLSDRHGALSFLEKNQVRLGDILSDVGFMGGYSLLRWQIDHHLNHISVLCGVRALPKYDSALTLVERFVKENPWIGSPFIEGRGAIPINAPHHDLVAPGLALLGDSACQVYAAHGSGIGMGLIAARFLSDTIIEAKNADHDIGSLATLARYQQRFHHKFYKRLFFSEHFRRFTQDLEPHHMTRLIESGLLNEELAKQSLLQLEPHISASSIIPIAKASLRAPRVVISMGPVLGKVIHGTIHARRLGKTSPRHD